MKFLFLLSFLLLSFISPSLAQRGPFVIPSQCLPVTDYQQCCDCCFLETRAPSNCRRECLKAAEASDSTIVD
ncbi:hypothetical protein PENTCL1PPCAC_22040 [Pristionchus entomophagus]|uniref:Uncharacterized protein n=1 Tax=Pristionchus entomophagus TaxID=358040 RepID=A0AAV5TZ63_9BILA|nr:hypothetical protein PENTCL1PPCAC_22040 [Pristionchus entomophagus]